MPEPDLSFIRGENLKNGGIYLKLFYALRKKCDKIVKVNI